MRRKPKGQRKKQKRQLLSIGSADDLLPDKWSPDYSERFFAFSHTYIKDLNLEISEALHKILQSYFQDFLARKHERMCRLDQPPQFLKREIESVYRNELTQKIKQLVHLESFQHIYHIFYDRLKSFLLKLFTEAQELQADPHLLLLVLSDALFTVDNAGEELSKITQGIFEHQPSLTCEHVVKLAFYEKVVAPFAYLVDRDAGDAARTLERLRLELTERKPQQISYCSAEDVDAIVDFIEGRRQPRRSKASTAETSLSPMNRSRNDSVDREVKQFKKRLKGNPMGARLKPQLSDKWVSGLRQLISRNSFQMGLKVINLSGGVRGDRRVC